MVAVFDPGLFQEGVFGGTFSKPRLRVFVDFNGDGVFDQDTIPGPVFQGSIFQSNVFGGVSINDEVTEDLKGGPGVPWERGRSADFGADATGQMSFTLNDIGATLSTPGKYTNLASVLLPGRSVLIKSEYGTTRPHFFGFIQRVTPDAKAFTVTVTCYDPLRRFQETDIACPANSYIVRTARDFRVDVLSDFERGVRNLVLNSDFSGPAVGWSAAGTFTSITTDGPSPTPTTCAHWNYGAAIGVASCQYTSRMAPVFFSGQTYVLSLYLKSMGQDRQYTLILRDGIAGTIWAQKNVTATNQWQRFSISCTPSSDMSGSRGLTVYIQNTNTSATGVPLRIGALLLTRGQALYDWVKDGYGRWANWCGSGSFDGSDLSGWQNLWTNLVTNGGFEVGTEGGWSNADDAHMSGAETFGVTTTNPHTGQQCLHTDTAIGGTRGAHYAFNHTFKAGHFYGVSFWWRTDGGTSSTNICGLGSDGTPADKFELTAQTITGAWKRFQFNWTPAADYTDVHFWFGFQTTGGPGTIDDVEVVEQVNPMPEYSITGPGGGGTRCVSDGLSTIARWGAQSHALYLDSVVGSGMAYDFSHWGAYFVAGQPYTLSMWLRPVTVPAFQAGVFQQSVFAQKASSLRYEIGIGGNNHDGGWDEATAQGTVPGDAWTQVTVTWVPGHNHASFDQSGTALTLDVVLFVKTLDGAGSGKRTLLVDGVRVIPGTKADDFEMPHWNLGPEPESYKASANFRASALEALKQLNGLTLTRHYIRPTLEAPYYEYVTSTRDQLASKQVVEVFDETFHGYEEADLDRDSIVNVVGIEFTGGTEYYSDADSIAKYGLMPGATISGGGSFANRTWPDVIGPALVDRYKDPRRRPKIARTGKSDRHLRSIMEREVDDLIEVSLGRAALSAQKYLIVKAEVKVSKSGVLWEADWTLEEYPQLMQEGTSQTVSTTSAFSSAFSIDYS